MNRVQQLLIADRLGEKLDGSRFHRPHRDADVRVARQKDDRNFAACIDQLLLKIQSAGTRHAHIEDEAGRDVRALSSQELLR